MASYQTQITAPDGDVPSLPEEFLNEGEKMFYDVIDDEEGGNAPAKGFSRRDVVESDLKALPFRRFDSEHFEFMYIPGSDAERDLEEIASKREYARGFICSLFAVDPQERHRIYVFETDAQSYCPTWGKTFASRAIPEGLTAKVNRAAVRVLPIFDIIAKKGNIPERDMFNTFNMGVGMVAAVDSADESAALEALKAVGVEAYVIGAVEAGDEGIIIW